MANEKVEVQNYPVVCCGEDAVAVNHSSIQLGNEFALEGFRQQMAGCDPTHMEGRPCHSDFILLLCFDNNHEGIFL